MLKVALNSTDGIDRTINLYMYGVDKILAQHLNNDIWVYKRQGKIRCAYVREPMHVDTETSHNHSDINPKAWIYQWAALFDGYTVGGRKPSQLIDYLRKYIKLYGLGESRKMIVYIHNLSYDICYLMDWLRSNFGNVRMMAIKAHKVLTFECVDVGLVFRCTYLLSNRSLAQWCEYTHSPVNKMINGIDYDLIRYQDTQLDYNDWYYQVNDVWSMHYSYNGMLDMFEDDISSIPLTNTGYIRRDCRREFKKDAANREHFIRNQISADVYRLLRAEFGGGLAHGNRFKIARVIKGDIGYYDYKSDYPSQQQLKYYPAGVFELYYKRGISRQDMTYDELISLCDSKCVLMELEFNNLRIKDGVTLPCLSVDKCDKGRCTPIIYTLDGKNRGNDNGRVLYMDGVTKLALLELDFNWIIKQYETDGIRIDTVYIADRALHPAYVRNVIDKYFEIKENAAGRERDKAKNNLNAAYGMEATDPVRADTTFSFDSHEWKEEKACTPADIQDALDKYYKSRNSFMQYYHGCYVTMHARSDILAMVERIGYKNFIYCDTDSIFFEKTPEAVDAINLYNKEVSALNIKMGLGVNNKDGERSYYGVFEDEKKDITAFKFLHAKCYGYIGKNGLKMTVAGVRQEVRDRNNNIITIVDELKGFNKDMSDIDALDKQFNRDFVFNACGGISATYIYDDARIEYINGHKTELASACILKPVTKTLNDAKWLKEYYENMEVESDVLFDL